MNKTLKIKRPRGLELVVNMNNNTSNPQINNKDFEKDLRDFLRVYEIFPLQIDAQCEYCDDKRRIVLERSDKGVLSTLSPRPRVPRTLRDSIKFVGYMTDVFRKSKTCGQQMLSFHSSSTIYVINISNLNHSYGG